MIKISLSMLSHSHSDESVMCLMVFFLTGIGW